MSSEPSSGRDEFVAEQRAERSRLEADLPASAVEEHVNILLVDDEPKNLTVLETILNNPGYRLVRAESADQALLALVVEEFALIVLDIHLPGMSGFELAHMIKQRRKTAGVPIIFLTAYYSEDQHVLEGYETGAVDYLHKPVNATILRSKVAVFVELHRRTRESVLANRALFNEVTERRRVQEQLVELNADLERRIRERTSELLEVNAALRDSEDRFRFLDDLSEAIRSAADAPQIMTLTVRILGERLGADRCAFAEALADGKSFAVRQAWSRGKEGIPTNRLEKFAREAAQKLRAGRVVVDRNTEHGEIFYAPLLKEGSLTAIFVVERRSETAWTEAEIVLAHEVIERCWAHYERARLTASLAEANRHKDEFLAMLGHELRNPLAPIRNAVSVLNHIGMEDPDLNWCRDVIDRQTRQLTRLVDDLLDVSRVSRGKIHLDARAVDLNEVVRQAVETSRPLIDARRHDLTAAYSPEPLKVVGDFSRLAQVVSNLLNNAAKYTDEQGRVGVLVERDPNDGKRAVIRVRDTGRGFDAATRNGLFKLFYQGARNLDRSDGGLGVGLALVRSLVEMHQGVVEAHSEGAGRGSEFVVRLPCAADNSPAASTAPPDEASQNTRGLNVLVVDDNRDSARSMVLLLTRLGHRVSETHDGHAAVETALRERPDVVLLDIGLPGLDGLQACRRMRAEGLTDARIVAMTGYGQDEDRRQSLEAGFDDHLVKPVDFESLRRVLATDLDRAAT